MAFLLGLVVRFAGLYTNSPVRIAPSCTDSRLYVVCQKIKPENTHTERDEVVRVSMGAIFVACVR